MAIRFADRSVPPSLPLGYAHHFRLFGGWQWVWVVCGIGVVLCWPAIISSFWLHLTNLALIAVVGAIGLNLLCGTARLISLGQAAFLGLGGFTASIIATELDLSFPIALIAAAIMGAAAGFLIAIPSLRLKAIYVAITTLAFHFAFSTGAAIYQAEAVHSHGIVMPIPQIAGAAIKTSQDWFYLLLLAALLAIVGGLNIRRSFVGRRWIAVADHEVASSAAGIGIAAAKISAFMITSAIVSVAGALGAYYEGVVTAEAYDLNLAIAYLAMIIVGGVGSVLGSVIGAFFITLLPYTLDLGFKLIDLEVSGGGLNGVHSMAYGLLIVLFMIFEPLGMAELWRRGRDWAVLWPFRYRGQQG